MEDEIMRELREVKEEYAKEHGYDPKKIIEHLRALQEASDEPVFDFSEEAKKNVMLIKPFHKYLGVFIPHRPKV